MFVHGIYAFYPDNSLFSLSDEEVAFFKRFDELIDDYFSKILHEQECCRTNL